MITNDAHLEALGIRRLDAFRAARDSSVPRTRLEAVRSAARAFHDALQSGPSVRYLQSRELVRVPFPVRYAYANVFTQRPLLSPVLHIANRLFVLQYDSPVGRKTLLFSPSDVMANAETRYFKRLGAGELARMEGKVGELSPGGVVKTLAAALVAPQYPTAPERLAELGIRPEDVDFISYDHLHTQELRNWLGTHERPAVFPNAKLLIMRTEWASAGGLLPSQADWYCPNATVGVPDEKVVLLDDDVMLGDGVALVRTPGHTMGNHSLVVRTDEGVFVSSENGVGVDNYAPEHSRIDALRTFAKHTGSEVVLNGNTQESSVEQYISMVMEKTIAGPSKRAPGFPNVANSSEFTSWWLFRGLDPSFALGDLSFGTYSPPRS